MGNPDALSSAPAGCSREGSNRSSLLLPALYEAHRSPPHPHSTAGLLLPNRCPQQRRGSRRPEHRALSAALPRLHQQDGIFSSCLYFRGSSQWCICLPGAGLSATPSQGLAQHGAGARQAPRCCWGPGRQSTGSLVQDALQQSHACQAGTGLSSHIPATAEP